MINFELLFNDLEKTVKNYQKRIEGDFSLISYYGISGDGLLRLAFLSSVEPPKLESTRLLKIVQGREQDNIYWTCFDLLSSNAKQVFYSFCGDLLECVKASKNQQLALVRIKERFHLWKNMFKRRGTQLTDEKTKGLFGELFFLNSYLSTKYGINQAIDSWSGPENTSKDFSTNQVWFEVKTIASTNNSVKISSLSQLSSNLDGYLIVNKIERMSESFNADNSSIEQLVSTIFSKIDSEIYREKFLLKLAEYGYDLDDDAIKLKFEVKTSMNYLVDKSFPKIVESDIKYQEISKISYELVLSTLERFKGDLF